MSDFSSRTVDLRKMLGLTQKEFGDAGNLSQSNLSNTENGKTLPNLDFVINIKNYFPKINLNWWIYGEGVPFIEEDERPRKLPNNINPDIKSFLENLREEVVKLNQTRSFVEYRKKKD